MDSNRHLIVFDLDETLIHSSLNELDYKCDFRVGDYYTYIRPNTTELISYCIDTFNIAVWSSATELYTKTVVKLIFPTTAILEFVWSRDKCSYRINLATNEFIWIKNLKKVKKLGFDLDKVIVIDDSPEKLSMNYGNLIKVEPFYGEQSDIELIFLKKYLKLLEKEENIRTIEKRRLQDQISS